MRCVTEAVNHKNRIEVMRCLHTGSRTRVSGPTSICRGGSAARALLSTSDSPVGTSSGSGPRISRDARHAGHCLCAKYTGAFFTSVSLCYWSRHRRSASMTKAPRIMRTPFLMTSCRRRLWWWKTSIVQYWFFAFVPWLMQLHATTSDAAVIQHVFSSVRKVGV